jgi:hypothetical protein
VAQDQKGVRPAHAGDCLIVRDLRGQHRKR